MYTLQPYDNDYYPVENIWFGQDWITQTKDMFVKHGCLRGSKVQVR